MIRSRVDSPKHDSLFLYTNIENVKITQSNSHKLEETIFFIKNVKINNKEAQIKLDEPFLINKKSM